MTTTCRASRSSLGVVVTSTRGGNSQKNPTTHAVTQHYRDDLDGRQIGDVSRDRAAVAKNRGYTGYEARRYLAQPVIDQHPFGFMAPCWRLLERAKDYMDQVGI